MSVTDAMLHLDALARSIPEPVFPPENVNSQLSGILRVTRPFYDTDRELINSNISVLLQQVSVYDTLLNRIDEIRSEMQSRRDAIYMSMAACSSALAPIRRLPSDVLRSVFREIQVSQWWNKDRLREEDHLQPLIFLQGPWTLSHVCGVWRDIVLSYPQLWSHIVLHFSSFPSGRLPRYVHHMTLALKTMILRSEQHPLDIAFELDSRHNKDMAAQALSVIVEVSHRWKTLLLHASLDLLDLLKPAQGKIPCLESLTLIAWVHTNDRGVLPEDTRSVFVDAPRLATVTLHSTHNLGNFKFPPHITHLAGCADSVPNLGVYHSLVECHIEGDKIFGNHIQVRDNSLPPIRVFLPSVRRLVLSSVQMLAHLCLPSLEDLTFFKFDRRGAPNSPLIMKDFISRSSCSLTRLAFHSLEPDISDQSFIQDTLLFMDTLMYLDTGLFWRLDNFFTLLPSDSSQICSIYSCRVSRYPHLKIPLTL